MRISIAQEILSATLATVGKAVSSKHTIPILSGILLEAQGDELLLRATDLELTIEERAKCQVHEAGAIVLPARYLIDLTRRIPFGEIEIDVNLQNHTAIFRWQKSQYTIHGFAAEQFPSFPDLAATDWLSLPEPTLRNLFRQTAFAVSHDETRPYLTGVNLTVQNEGLTATATDGVRIAHTRHHQGGLTGSGQAIVPSRSVNELSRLLSDDEEKQIRVAFGDNQLLFEQGTLRLASRLLEGTFPDVMRLVPQEYSSAAQIEKGAFVEALERASLLTKDGAVKLSFSEGLLKITSNSPEGGQGYEEIPCQYRGEPLEIGFNSRYLIEGLRSVETPTFAFEFTRSNGPARITPTDEADFFYLVLPLIITF